MSLEELRNALRTRPFRPFRLFVSDGGTYDIRHPELCVPGGRSVFIGLLAPSQQDPTWDSYAIVDLIHITRTETLEVPAHD